MYLGLREALILLKMCLGVNALALVLNVECWKLGCLEWWWLGVFIALNHHIAIGDGCCRWVHRTLSGAPATSPNRYGPGASNLWRLCFLVAPESPVPHRTGTVHYPVRLWRLLWLLRALFAHCSSDPRFCSRPLRQRAIAPLVHRIVWWIIAEHALRNSRVESWTLYGPGAPDTVQWHTGQSGALDQGTPGFFAPLYSNPIYNLLLVCVEPLCTCRTCTLEQTS
jgi:hypothetical protein